MATLLAPQDSINMAQAQWLEMFAGLFNNGVMAGQLNTYTVTTTSGLGISVASGRAMIQGFLARSDAAVALTCATADPSNPRIDRAVLHADLTAHTLSVILLTGTPAGSPVPPTLTQTATVWEISLYQIRVNALQTTLTGGSLTNERTYSVANIPTAGLTDAMMANQKVNRTGDTMTGALSVPQINGQQLTGADDTLFLNSRDGTRQSSQGAAGSGGAPWFVYDQTNAGYIIRASKGGLGVTPPLQIQRLVGDASDDAIYLTSRDGSRVSSQGALGGSVPWFVYDQTNNAFILQASKTTWIMSPGITSIAGQATAGSFGVPLIVAQAVQVHVTATSVQTILTYTPAVDSSYRASAHLSIGANVVSHIDFHVNYTDPNLGSPPAYFAATGQAGTYPSSVQQLDGLANVSSGVSAPTLPVVIRAKASTAITVSYLNPSGTPNDWIDVFLERLA